MRQQRYFEAYLDDFDKVVVYMSKNSYDGSSNKFYVRNDLGELHDLHIQSIEQTMNNYHKYTLTLQSELTIGREYYVVHQHARSVILEYSGIVKTERFDELFYYEGNDLGYTLTRKQTSFALWAPTASRVKLEIKRHDVVYTYEMQRTMHGVYRFSILDNLENATYVYFVRVHGVWQEAIDPYGVASIENALRSAIVDLQKIKMKSYDLPDMKSACDAIIYEASVRDFTIQEGNGIYHPGTFLGFVEENEKTISKNTGFTYLKSLGITHLQLMPVLDFGSVNELYPKLHYNWGYDPMQYCCLEGSFSSDSQNPYARIFEFVKLVEECHKHNIRVNLDVVFNHVYDKEKSSFDLIVPNYYFQMNEAGEFSNGTYCGNDMDSKRKMCSKFIVDACVFLTKTYHIDGLRFDLMGILNIDTLNRVHACCTSINPDFMIYGEGWDMPSLLDYRQRASMNNQKYMPFIAHFSDRFRDVVKGRTSSNEANVKGYCSGAIYLLDIMKNCLSASCTPQGGSQVFTHPINVVNYVECHDNMTTWDKVKECCKEEPREIRIQRQNMMNAAVLLAQGIPFLHCGQEFLRTKHGMANTYEECDEINKIDYHRRNQFLASVENVKELIRIRKQYACLRYATQEEVQRYVSFDSIEQKVLVYKMKDECHDMIIFFNPSQTSTSYELGEDYHLLYNNGRCENAIVNRLTIEPYTTMIVTK